MNEKEIEHLLRSLEVGRIRIGRRAISCRRLIFPRSQHTLTAVRMSRSTLQLVV